MASSLTALAKNYQHVWCRLVICEHSRQRRYCKECGGSGICEHGRRRYRCKECRAANVKQRW